MELAKSDASRLYSAGEARAGTDESVFVEIFTKRNAAQLRATFDHYGKLSDYDIEKVVGKETSMNFQKALKAIGK